MPMIPSADHTITLSSDGSTHHYHLRSLQLDQNATNTKSEVENESVSEAIKGGTEGGGMKDTKNDKDIAKWTQFCASVFSYKANPPPPSYFARHFYNDPRHDADLVRVLIHVGEKGANGEKDDGNSAENEKEGEMVSSVRIFKRTISTGPDSPPIEAGGIGEVCTLPSHQRRGLSKILLKDAIKIMEDSNEENVSGGISPSGVESMACSLLHASPDFRPVYRKVGGYECVRSQWTLAPIALQHLSSEKQSTSSANDGTYSNWSIRHADFTKDTKQLKEIHSSYSEQRFAGCIIRSEQYWNEYVSAELGDTLWVLTGPMENKKAKLETAAEAQSSQHGEEKILAWISIRKRGDRYQLREFGVDKSAEEVVPTSWAMQKLLGVALAQAGEKVGENGEKNEKDVSLLLPTAILSEMKDEGKNESFVNIEQSKDEFDDGWMYVIFDESKPNIFDLTARKQDPVLHLIWPTDSF